MYILKVGNVLFSHQFIFNLPTSQAGKLDVTMFYSIERGKHLVKYHNIKMI